MMAGLRIRTFFWYLDAQVTKDVLAVLKEGKFDMEHSHPTERDDLRSKLIDDPPDLVIADFDLMLKKKSLW